MRYLDIVDAVKYCAIKLFANDALFGISDTNVISAGSKLKSDLDEMRLCGNKLKLNVTETKYMIINSN